MKTFNDFRPSQGLINLRETTVISSTHDPKGGPPMVLLLKRKYIRVLPEGLKVAVYYSQQLDKHITIPFSELQESLHEAETKSKKPKPIESINNLAILQNIIAKNKGDILKFIDQSEMEVGVPEANEIMAGYARLSPENQKKIGNQLNKSAPTITKLLQFFHDHNSEGDVPSPTTFQPK